LGLVWNYCGHYCNSCCDWRWTVKYAAQFLLGGIATLLAIAPIPYQKWALPRLALGSLSIACFSRIKYQVDIELEDQRRHDVWDFQEARQEQRLLQESKAITVDGMLQTEALRARFQAEREMAHLQRDRAIVL